MGPDGRLLFFDITVDECQFQITNVYALTAVAQRLAFFQEINRALDSSLSSFAASSHQILFGDFNNVMDLRADHRSVLHRVNPTSGSCTVPVKSNLTFLSHFYHTSIPVCLLSGLEVGGFCAKWHMLLR